MSPSYPHYKNTCYHCWSRLCGCRIESPYTHDFIRNGNNHVLLVKIEGPATGTPSIIMKPIADGVAKKVEFQAPLFFINQRMGI